MKPTKTPRGELVLEGIGVSPGIAIGPVHARDSSQLQVVEYQIPKGRIAEEKARVENAVAKAKRQLSKLRQKALASHGAAGEELGFLLEAHEQMLQSRRLLDGIILRIEEKMVNAEAAVATEIAAVEASFAAIADPYFRARASEVRDVGQRLLRALSDKPFASFGEVPSGSILLAEEISPADTALMDPKVVRGFASQLGGAEGHTAIMARSLGLPAVLGISGLMAAARAGEVAIVDGGRGQVILRPTKRRLQSYEKKQAAQDKAQQALGRLSSVKAMTLDGARVSLFANLELPRDLPLAIKAGAEGVGLLRTEFLFMNRPDLPDEEEQTQHLSEIVQGMKGRPVTIRTLDVGGEKLATALGDLQINGTNPALGLRAIRLSLREPKLLETQLAAILRAGALGPVRILLPMISTLLEVEAVRDAMKKVAERLRKRGKAVADPLPPLGVMIEVPGAALAADALARVADFFAIGTNDLTMYTLAIDRAEERVAHLYNPLHPAVLRLIQFAVEAALRARIPVSVCGETAGDPRFTPLFLGLGIRELSMSAQALPRVKARVLDLKAASALHLAGQVMAETDPAAIAKLLENA